MTRVAAQIACRVPGCRADSVAFVGGTPLCRSHYCAALEALAALGESPRTFRGQALDLILLQRVREDVRVTGLTDA